MTAPITPDERAAMRALAIRMTYFGEVGAADGILRLLDALDTAEAEVARLREEAARPAPVWDEDTVWDEVQGAVARVVAPYTSGPMDPLDVQVTDAVLAVVREHLPVRPDRETARYAGGRAYAEGGGPWDVADAVLALWPGESRASVQAEALRDWISEWPTTPGDGTFLADVARDGLARADRLDPKEADRG